MSKTVPKPIQVALDCILWRKINVQNFKQVYRKLLRSNKKCKSLNKFINSCKKIALNNAGCKIVQTTGKLLNVTDNFLQHYICKICN